MAPPPHLDCAFPFLFLLQLLGHQVLDALALGGRVVLAVTFQKVDAAPHAQAAAQGDDQSLQNVDSVGKKAHIHISFRSVELSG